MQLDFG